ncbi:hypothetical protein QJS04_geneDACA005812 [Acorus gramineus]|uniref:Uncharacterized protein n=1 Tax=Acorus gramineus TaxID=55184 RepID=A0AAV9B6Y8_ACOGR|nr:hypothetical protein QJS04_geneDACA005812 [Acorus gramineus]
MEEGEQTMSLILHGCALARDLESNIAGYLGQPELLLASCDRISDVFRQASDRLRSPPPPPPPLLPPPPPQPIGDVALFKAPDYPGPTTVGGTDFEAAGPSVQRAATRKKKWVSSQGMHNCLSRYKKKKKKLLMTIGSCVSQERQYREIYRESSRARAPGRRRGHPAARRVHVAQVRTERHPRLQVPQVIALFRK